MKNMVHCSLFIPRQTPPSPFCLLHRVGLWMDSANSMHTAPLLIDGQRARIREASVACPLSIVQRIISDSTSVDATEQSPPPPLLHYYNQLN